MLSRRTALLAPLFLATALSAKAAENKPFTPEAFAAAQAAGQSIIVHIYAPWCPTCRAQEPIIDTLGADPKFNDLKVFRIDFDGQKSAVRAMKAMRQSTIVAFKGARETGRLVGETSADAIAALFDKTL